MTASRTRRGLAALVLALSAPPHTPARGTAVQGTAVQGTAAPSEGQAPGRDLGAASAADAVAAAVAACAERGWPVTAAAVDRAGQVKALLRGDGAESHTVAAALAKAYAAAGLRDSTAALLDAVQRVLGTRYPPAIEDALNVGGGLPIRAGDEPGAEMAGAVGVSGAPSGKLDEGCARAGVARARAGLR